MVEKKNKPPSRERYEEKNPCWTVRMPKEWIDEINAFLEDSDQSRRNFMAIALEKQKTDYSQVHDQGYIEGFNSGHAQGFNKFALPCHICGKNITFDLNNNTEAAKKIYETFGSYAHSECIEEQKKQREAEWQKKFEETFNW